MKKAIALTFAGVALMAGTPSALAQNAEPAQAAAAVSDADIKAYAAVVAKTNALEADTSLSEAEKSAQLAATLKANDMTPAKLNAITAASHTDPQLKQKIQAAMTK